MSEEQGTWKILSGFYSYPEGAEILPLSAGHPEDISWQEVGVGENRTDAFLKAIGLRGRLQKTLLDSGNYSSEDPEKMMIPFVDPVDSSVGLECPEGEYIWKIILKKTKNF